MTRCEPSYARVSRGEDCDGALGWTERKLPVPTKLERLPYRLHHPLVDVGCPRCHTAEVVDRLFPEPILAELYDAFCAGRPDFGFYLPLVMSADSVLDVGCGTGELLRLAREAGHTGRLCGLDPAEAMLEQARKRPDVEWVHGDLSSVEWCREFDLVVMTGHAFQVLVENYQLRESLASIRSALTLDGRFVSETRNPLARGWERWIPDNEVEVAHGGSVVRMAHQVELPVTGDVVSFTATFTSPDWDRPQVSRSTLRFLDVVSLSSFLSALV